MKKGFTLIELLAVIVILAIILLIAMPIVLNVISEARKGAFEATARGLIKTVENEYMKNAINNDTSSKTYVFEDYVQTTGDLEFSGKAPKNGYIHVTSDGKVGAVIEDGTWIVTKELDEKDIATEELDEQDIEIVFNQIIGGGEAGFVCEDTLTDDRDSKTYATVQIGTQCWMAENLAYTDSGTLACLTNTWKNHTQSAPWDACRVNGGAGWDQHEVLYQWGAAMDGNDGLSGDPVQGLCPVGWELPTDDEWTTLTDYLSANSEYWWGADWRIAKALASTANWEDCFDPNPATCFPDYAVGYDQSLNNATGFNGKPVGYRYTSGSLTDVERFVKWWTASPSGSAAWVRDLYVEDAAVSRYSSSQAYGYSVRCVLGL